MSECRECGGEHRGDLRVAALELIQQTRILMALLRNRQPVTDASAGAERDAQVALLALKAELDRRIL